LKKIKRKRTVKTNQNIITKRKTKRKTFKKKINQKNKSSI
jgi:hypothetical protein